MHRDEERAVTAATTTVEALHKVWLHNVAVLLPKRLVFAGGPASNLEGRYGMLDSEIPAVMVFW